MALAPGQERSVALTLVDARHPEAKPAIRREDNIDLAIPQALKGRIDRIRVKTNYERHDADEATDERYVSSVLIIGFRGGYQQGIKGLQLSDANQNDFRKRAWTHLTIECLPEPVLDAAAGLRDWNRDPFLDERGTRITWWRRGSGGQRKGQKDGEEVKSLCDELQVLEWLIENDLEALYEIGCLRGILPLRDEDRERMNEIAAQVHTYLGAALSAAPTVPDHEFHYRRLWHRIAWLVSCGQPEQADEERVFERYAQTKIGNRTKVRAEDGLETGQRFFVNADEAIACAVYCWPAYREAVIVDLVSNVAEIQPLEENGKGLAFYEDAILGKGFVEIDRVKFHDLVIASHAGHFKQTA